MNLLYRSMVLRGRMTGELNSLIPFLSRKVVGSAHQTLEQRVLRMIDDLY